MQISTISISALIIIAAMVFQFSTDAQLIESNDLNKLSSRPCRIRAVDPLMHGVIRNALDKENLNLLEYRLTFRNYSYNPMTTNVTRYYQAHNWARVSTHHGQTIRSLAFNYGILSLMTLTLGTKSMPVELEDIPTECFGELPEKVKVEMVQNLLMRDFEEAGNVSVFGDEKVCNVQITNQSGYAKFNDYCCSVDVLKRTQTCDFNIENKWLRFLWVMITVVRFGVLIFGPLLFLSTIAKLVSQKTSYVVRLIEPLKKKILLFKQVPDGTRFNVKRRVNLKNSNCGDLPKLMDSICRMSSSRFKSQFVDGKPFLCFIYDYRIMVSYPRLLVENEVPIGLWKLLLNTVFFCELAEMGPFVDCCKQRICNMCKCIQWIKFWKAIGLTMLVLILPMPYYVRLIIFYYFEHDEVISREEAASRMGLMTSFENSLLHSFQPTHPFFLGIYTIYFTVAIAFAFASKMKENKVQTMIVGSFDDLSNLSWVSVLHMIVSNVIWPFEKFGLFAIFIVFIYWPIVVPITCIVSLGYCLPTVYLTLRMQFYPESTILARVKSYFAKKSSTKLERNQQLFEIKNIWNIFYGSNKSNDDRKPIDIDRSTQLGLRSFIMSIMVTDSEIDKIRHFNPKVMAQSSVIDTKLPTQLKESTCREIVIHVVVSTFCVVAMYSVLIILSECIGCLVEVMFFTMMGIIVNAGALLKYTALAILLIVYVYDSFNNVEKKYLQLNKALFNIVKDRVKGLEEVTSQPAELQENTAFKSQELSEQGEHEDPDDVARGLSRQWFINDLVLFVDKEDVPRIPKKLFEEVCEIQVAGVPGPVYLGLLSALKSFVKIAIFVMFVFLAILSFGNAYGLSSTAQTIAALAGGSVPLLMKTFIKPPKSDIDMGTVSFTNKLDEVVMNFYQFWPLNDFCFEMQLRKKKEVSTNNVAPVDSEEDIDSGEDIDEVKTSDSIPGIFSLGADDGSATGRSDAGEICKLMRKELRREREREDVDIAIILPNDFDEHWNDEWSKFRTRMTKEKDKTAVRESRKMSIKRSRTRRKRVDFAEGAEERSNVKELISELQKKQTGV